MLRGEAVELVASVIAEFVEPVLDASNAAVEISAVVRRARPKRYWRDLLVDDSAEIRLRGIVVDRVAVYAEDIDSDGPWNAEESGQLGLVFGLVVLEVVPD